MNFSEYLIPYLLEVALTLLITYQVIVIGVTLQQDIIFPVNKVITSNPPCSVSNYCRCMTPSVGHCCIFCIIFMYCLDITPKYHCSIFFIIHWYSYYNCSWNVCFRDFAFGGNYIEPFHHILYSVSYLHFWDSVIWKSTINGCEYFFDCFYCVLNLWNILLCC